MADASPIARQWAILVALSTRRNGLTIRELATEHRTTQRTIRRDLATLQCR